MNVKNYRLHNHVVQLTDSYGLDRVLVPGLLAETDGASWIGGPEINESLDYWVWMHELGHVARDHNKRFDNSHDRLDAEADAWEWALENAIIEPDDVLWGEVATRLGGYLRGYTDPYKPREYGPPGPTFRKMYRRALTEITAI